MYFHSLTFSEACKLLFYTHDFKVRKHHLSISLTTNNVYEKGISELPSAIALNTSLEAGILMICNHMLRGFPSVQLKRLNLFISCRAPKNRGCVPFIYFISWLVYNGTTHCLAHHTSWKSKVLKVGIYTKSFIKLLTVGQRRRQGWYHPLYWS